MAKRFISFIDGAKREAVAVERVYLVQDEGDCVRIWFDEGDDHDYIKVREPFGAVMARLNGEEPACDGDQ